MQQYTDIRMHAMNAITPNISSLKIGQDEAKSTPLVSTGHDISAKLVSSLEERQMVIAVRAAVFLGDEGGRYSQHFDGNDQDAAFVLAFVDGDPVGTMRVRFFNGLARFDKLAILKAHRTFPVLNTLVTTALRLSRLKGYDRACGAAREEVVSFWRRKGLKPGQPLHTKYGTLVPLAGTIPSFSDIEPIAGSEWGTEAFEQRMFAWEGLGL